MPVPANAPRHALIAVSALLLSACVGSYTGPVEVTRFVSEQPVGLGSGEITIQFPEEMSNTRARNAFEDAVAAELRDLGYTITPSPTTASQSAAIRTSRTPLSSIEQRGPVNVGVGGRTGTYGSGVGLGVGINLGGGSRGPTVMSELSVRISGPDGESIWEGRAQQPVSVNSPYADVEASAQTLAAALFSDFPGGNGETVTIAVDELRR